MIYDNGQSLDKSSEVQNASFLTKTPDIKSLKNPSKETLAIFGRLLYAVAMADGNVQRSEIEALEAIVENDEWAKEIELSFKKGASSDMNPQTMFMKNMRVFFSSPASDHYPYFLNLMEKIANAHNGMVSEERKMIDRFKDMYFQAVQVNRKKKPYYFYKLV